MATKLKNIIDMPYESLIELSKKENIEYLKSTLKYASESANRRIKTLLNSPIGSYSPAYKNLTDAGIKNFDIKWLKKATSKDTGKMLNQLANVRKFLKAKTSTIQGWNAVRTKVRNRTGAKRMFAKDYKSKRSATIWQNKEKRFWKLYNRLVDEFGGIISELDSERIQRMLYRIQNMKNVKKSDEMIQGVMEKYIDELYRAKQKGMRFNDSTFEDDIRIIYRK